MARSWATSANASQAGSAIANATKGAGSGALFSAEAGIGFKSSSSSADGSSTVSRGSTIQGGGNVNLTSTSGDIHIVQGNLSAGNTLALDSARDILLEAGQAHMQDKSKSNNAGAEVGVGVSVGAQTGVYVYAEASVGSGKSKSDSSTWQNTELTGKNISIKAEGGTTLRGATATADRIDVKTGGTLTIESLQDIAESMSKDSQVGGRVQVSFGTAWDVSGYASASKANGSYKGVGQQSGLFAGDGGYHVDAGHVNLIGGAIASTNAANSELTAETFTFTDLKNEMDYRASSASISGGFGHSGEGAKDANGNPTAAPGAAGQLKDIGSNVANGKFGNANGTNFSGGVPMNTSGSDSSTTYASLTEGNITIGGKKVTAEELGVNTDPSKAHEAISTLPDLQKLMQEQQAISSAAGTVVATSKQVAGDVYDYKSKIAREAYEKSIENDPVALKNYNDMSAGEREKFLVSESPAYGDAKKWGTGGEYSRALDAVTIAIVGGVAGQGGSQVAANALAPYAAQFIGSQFDPNHGANPDGTLQLISHALLGALLAEANGGSAGNGALAAGGGELAAKFLTDALYGGDPSKLSEQEKQTVLALSQAVGALAGAGGGNGLNGASLGASIAGNSVENNFLGQAEKAELDRLRIKQKNEKLTPQESLLLAVLDAGDHLSDGLLNKVLRGEEITEVQMRNLELYLANYEKQNGEGSANALLAQGIRPIEVFPYAGLSSDKQEFSDAHFSWGSPGVTLWSWLSGHDRSPNEEAFNQAVIGSGLLLQRTEDLMPTVMKQRSDYALMDALSSSALAGGAYIYGLSTNMSEADRNSFAILIANISGALGSVTAGKTGLLPVTGALGVSAKPTVRGQGEQALGNLIAPVVGKKYQSAERNNLQLLLQSGGKSFTPDSKVKVSDAHSVDSITSETRFGGGSRNTPKSVAKGGVDIAADIDEIASGRAVLLPNGDIATSSGRTYGRHPGSNTVYPKDGPGLVQLTQAEFEVYKKMVRDGGLSGGALRGLEGMIKSGNPGVNSSTKARLGELFGSREGNKATSGRP